MTYDPAPSLFDPRTTPPEPADWDHSPGHEAERAFHEALGEWRKQDPEALTPGPECPVCRQHEVAHLLGCWMAAEGSPSYRYNPASYHLPTRL